MAESAINNCSNCESKECAISLYCSPQWQQHINLFKTVVHYKKGQLIIKEGTEAFGIHIIYSGKALIMSESKGNRRQIIRLAKEGDILEYIQKGNRLMYPFSAEALDNCTICYLPWTKLSRMLQEENNLTFHMERRYAHLFIAAEKKLRNAMIMNSNAKVADALLIISDAFDGKVPLLRKEIGEMIGISAEQVSREIRKLIGVGIVESGGASKEVIIKDEKGLRSIVNDYDSQYQVL